MDSTLWPVPGVLGSCGGGGEEVLRSGLLLHASDKGSGCCLACSVACSALTLEDCCDMQRCVLV